MGRKRRKTIVTTTHFKSNALLPARAPSKPAMLPFRIKTEKDDEKYDEAHQRAENLEDSIDNQRDCSSDASTVPQHIEFHQSVLLQNNSNYHMKKEPIDSVLGMDCSADEDPYILTHAQHIFINNDSLVTSENAAELQVTTENEKNPLKRKVSSKESPKVNLKKIKIKSDDDDQSLMDQAKGTDNSPSEQNIENSDTNILSEYICESIEFDSSADVKLKKVAVNNNENFQEIKVEANVNNDNTTVLSILKSKEDIPKHLKYIVVDNEKKIQDIKKESNVDDEIVVLTVPKVEKNIPVINISDEEDDQDSGSQNLAVESSSTSLQALISTNTDKENKFSVDILKFFNVVSELDRGDCQQALDYLHDKRIHHNKSKETLQKNFPLQKKGKNSREIEKYDNLFKEKTAHSNPDYECLAISTNVCYNTPDNIISPSTAGSMTLNTTFSNLSTSHSSKLSPPMSELHASTTFGLIPTNLWTPESFSPNSNTEKYFHHISVDQLKEALSYLQKDYDLMIPEANNKTVASGSSVQVTNSTAVHTQAPYQISATLSNCNLQRSSHSDTPLPQSLPQAIEPLHNHDSTLPFAAVASSSVNRDPRVAAKTTFPPRKGFKDLLLYRKVGNDFIHEYFEKIVLQWNPEWAEIQRNSGIYPPICDSYPYVTSFYPNEIVYYNTYVPLHMLHIWQTIFDWYCQVKKKDIKCKYRSGEKEGCTFKITCTTELEVSEIWPKRDDLVVLKYNEECIFARIIDVEKGSIDSEVRKKLKINLESTYDLNFQYNNECIINIILNIRIEQMRTEALILLNRRIKDLILNPKNSANNIAMIQLADYANIKEQRDAILKKVYSEHISATVVEACDNTNTIVLITLLVYSIVFCQKDESAKDKQTKVFICLKNKNSFFNLVRRLLLYNPVLAVRNKLISLPLSFVKHTFENRLCHGETVKDVLQNHHIFISTISAFDLAEKSHLSKQHRLIGIIDEANLCTEAETALPLSLKLNKILLIGKKGQNAALPPILMNYEYHVSLFHRLLKAKQKF